MSLDPMLRVVLHINLPCSNNALFFAPKLLVNMFMKFVLLPASCMN